MSLEKYPNNEIHFEDSSRSIPRFVINDGRIVDKLNLGRPRVYWHEGDPQDQMYLREQVLRVGLIHLVDPLMRNNPQDQPLREGSVLVSDTIFQAIRASHFNTFDPMVSFEARFFGNVKQSKFGLAAFCSISLFINDIECLLRDLYGDIDGKALHRILSAGASYC